MEEYFLAVRSQKASATSVSILNDRKNEQNILSSLIPYLKDSVAEVRYAAYTLLSGIGQRSTSLPVRQEVMTSLVRGWRDKDSGINGMVGSCLQQFKPSDFNNTIKDSLRSLVNIIPPHYNKLVKLCGYVGMKDQVNVIQSQIQKGVIKSKNDKWAAYLALCRLGDKQTLTYVMQRVEKLGVNDDVVYEVFPDLIYTRQREAFNYLIKAINSDEKNCESANSEISSMIPCGYRIMEYMAPVIKDFPLKTDASGDVITKDYEQALTQVREWFKNEGEHYVIEDHTF
jgi:hypothetical protein